MVSRLDSVQSAFSQEVSILDLTRDHQATIDWLYANNLLKKQVVCPKCSLHQLHIEKDKTKADQMRYRCPDKRCRKTVSIRIGSIFEDSKLTLIESTRLIFSICKSFKGFGFFVRWVFYLWEFHPMGFKNFDRYNFFLSIFFVFLRDIYIIFVELLLNKALQSRFY